jgi:hypothetical protein
MKNLYLLLLIILPFFGQSQINFSILDQNNAKASISDNGNFFYPTDSTTSYRVPKDSLQGLIYSATNWFGGVDAGGQIKLCGTDLYGGGTDLWAGGLTTGGSANTGSASPSQTIWTVTKAQIYFHLTHYQNPGYTPSPEIASWPAHGDIAQGFDYNLAPFVDENLDGNYNPMDGDYPCIKGDKATFMVMNDKKSVHGSGGDPIGLELQYMFYQYETSELANTTFIDLKIINRGTQTLFDFHTSFVLDGDLGNPVDDYFGCDTNRNVQYYYNDSLDQSFSGNTGYGAAPPSFGVVCLSENISTATSLNGIFGASTGVASKYNIMKGIDQNGALRYDNTGTPTTFMYYDAPSNLTGWNALNSGSPGDQKTAMSINMGTLSAFAEKNLTYAIVYSRDGNSNIANVDSLLQKVDMVQAFYDGSTDGNCGQSILALDETSKVDIEISIFPNPSNGEFQIKVGDLNQFDLTIQDMTGRIILQNKNVQANAKVLVEAPSGIYVAIINTEKGTFSRRISIR